MAKIKIKFGESEIEIDSRDFYVDNQTIGQVIDNITKSMQDNKARIIIESTAESEKPTDSFSTGFDVLNELEDAEAFEPEFNEPVPISISEVKEKLKFLESKNFFDTPKTVSETVEQLREYGWSASLLDVSKVLAKMAFSREILSNSREQRNYYFVKEALLST
ncbi:MAG: hypothetical protein R3230_05245 [Nitrosopumilaceae archaeon]|nr:hypothetical protein [Nitrosopumilaceae archaeon]